MLTASTHAMSTPPGSKGAAVAAASTKAFTAASAYCSTSSRESDAASRRWRYGCAHGGYAYTLVIIEELRREAPRVGAEGQGIDQG